MARLRKAPVLQAQTQPAAPTTRRALKEKTNTTVRVPAPRYEDDGNTESMVTDAKPRRGRPKKQAQQDSNEMLIAGAIGPSDEPASVSDMPTTTDELAKSDAPPPSFAKGNRRPTRTVRKVAQNEAQTKVLQGLKQRMAATARGQRTKVSTSSAPLDVAAPSLESLPAAASARNASTRKSRELTRSEDSKLHSPSLPEKLSANKGKRFPLTQPGSVLKAQSTPAVETSILALKNFKRRPRQPSMLAMVQQRTASARPSAVHTDLAVEDSSIYDFDFEDEDDFAPEAEGTPLNVAKKKKRKSIPQIQSSVKRRKSTTEDAQDDTGGDCFPAAEEIVRSSSERAETPPPAVYSDIYAARARSFSTPPSEPSSSNRLLISQGGQPIVPSTDMAHLRERDQNIVQVPSTALAQNLESRDPYDNVENDGSIIDALNGTMAEPASSSPTHAIAPEGSQWYAETADSPKQVSPARISKPKKQKPVSTASLQALLPKRRKALKPRRRKSVYDMGSESGAEEDAVVDTSHLEDDEDELGGELRRRVPSKARGVWSAREPRASKAAASKARQQLAARSRKASIQPASKAGARTYGRTTILDKENDEAFDLFDEADGSILPDVSMSMHDAASGKELEEAKRMFAEVDDWDMEFESMSQEDHRSSSQGWR